MITAPPSPLVIARRPGKCGTYGIESEERKMAERLNIFQTDPKATHAVLAMENYAKNSGLDRGLYELIKIRASQLNGCAFCLDMHLRDARDRKSTRLNSSHVASSYAV